MGKVSTRAVEAALFLSALSGRPSAAQTFEHDDQQNPFKIELSAQKAKEEVASINPFADPEICKNLMKEQLQVRKDLEAYEFNLEAVVFRDSNNASDYKNYTLHSWMLDRQKIIVPIDDETYIKQYVKDREENFSKALKVYQEDDNIALGNYYMTQNKIRVSDGLSEGDEVETSLDDLKVLMKQMNFKTRSVIRHELQHRENDLLDTYRAGLSPAYMAKLNILDEISANIAQADEALDYYKETGSLDGFDMLYNCGKDNIPKIKEWVEAHPDEALSKSPECAKFMAETLCSGFLERNNRLGAHYAGSAVGCATLLSMGYEGRTEVEMQVDYQQRVKKMFSNIEGLGNVSQYIDPNFKLFDGFEQTLELSQSNFKNERISGVQKALEISDEMTQTLLKGMVGDEKNPEKQMENVQKAFKNIHGETSQIKDETQKRNTIDAMLMTYYNKAYYR